MPYVNVQITEGATRDQKRAIVEDITRSLVERLGKRPEHIHIVLQEVAEENWGFEGINGAYTRYRINEGGLLSSASAFSTTVTIPSDISAGSMTAIAQVYPSPLASMEEALNALLREPHGCFEQTSSTNYQVSLAIPKYAVRCLLTALHKFKGYRIAAVIFKQTLKFCHLP